MISATSAPKPAYPHERSHGTPLAKGHGRAAATPPACGAMAMPHRLLGHPREPFRQQRRLQRRRLGPDFQAQLFHVELTALHVSPSNSFIASRAVRPEESLRTTTAPAPPKAPGPTTTTSLACPASPSAHCRIRITQYHQAHVRLALVCCLKRIGFADADCPHHRSHQPRGGL